jgi:hypothetical protein
MVEQVAVDTIAALTRNSEMITGLIVGKPLWGNPQPSLNMRGEEGSETNTPGTYVRKNMVMI